MSTSSAAHQAALQLVAARCRDCGGACETNIVVKFQIKNVPALETEETALVEHECENA